MKLKTKNVQKLLSTQKGWSLVNADEYSQFYIRCNKDFELKTKTTNLDEQLQEETKSFYHIKVK